MCRNSGHFLNNFISELCTKNIHIDYGMLQVYIRHFNLKKQKFADEKKILETCKTSSARPLNTSLKALYTIKEC